jgi:hypothetical protein
MKAKLPPVAVATAVLLALNPASIAAPSVGFYAFNGNKPLQASDQPANYAESDVFGWVTSPLQATQGSGGCYDGDYGNGSATDQPMLARRPPGDGSATIRKLDAGALSAYSVLTFWITNHGLESFPLAMIYFDAAEPPPAGSADQLLLMRIWDNAHFDPRESAQWWEFGMPVGGDIVIQGEESPNDFPGYARSLGGRTVGPGETVAIMFSGRIADPNNPYDSNTIWIDNVGINDYPKYDPYSAWAINNGFGHWNADDDGDGFSNLFEFASDTDAGRSSSIPRNFPSIQLLNGVNTLTCTVAVLSGAWFNPGSPVAANQLAYQDGVFYTVEASTNLNDWDTVVVTELAPLDAAAVRAAMTPALPVLDVGWQWHTFRTDRAIPTEPGVFFRLRVNR